MSVLSYFKKEMNRGGVTHASKKTISKIIKRITGVDKLEEENKTLFYFLNTFFDVRDTPRANGPLRDLQLCDVALLQIFDKVCEKYDIPYWIDYGTLLGAHRHKGFIPWDDDLDVAMKRDDYNRALPILKKVLESFGLEADEKPGAPMVRMGIGYKHENTGVWLDVFPVDVIQSKMCRDDIISELFPKMMNYRKFYYKKRNKIPNSEMIKKKEELIKILPGEYTILYHGPEYVDVSLYAHDMSDVFPLRTVSFEGVKLKGPNNCEMYLERIYGKNYMSFPHDGVEHHGDDGHRLAQWAEQSGTDMKVILKELQDILNKI